MGPKHANTRTNVGRGEVKAAAEALPICRPKFPLRLRWMTHNLKVSSNEDKGVRPLGRRNRHFKVTSIMEPWPSPVDLRVLAVLQSG